MKKFKKLCCLLMIMITILPYAVSAKTNQYYVNSDGGTLTKDEYEYMLKHFSERTISSMTKEMIDLLKGNDMTTTVEETYVKTSYITDASGNIISTEDKEYTEEQYQEYMEEKSNQITPYASDYIQDSWRRLTVSVTMSGASSKTVTVTNRWLTLPKVRSYDVIAIRPETRSATINNNSLISGYQAEDGNMHNYYRDGANTKIDTSGLGTSEGGVGISMNLVNGSTQYIECSITVVFLSGSSVFKARGAYQHANVDVTQAESKKYSIRSNGNGGVIKFDSSVSSKYTNWAGVSAEWNINNPLD